MIVGNLISATALGAVGLTSSMTWLLTAICTSIGAGVNIAVAQYFGAKKETDIQESISRLLSDCRDRKYIFNCRLLFWQPVQLFSAFCRHRKKCVSTVWHTF